VKTANQRVAFKASKEKRIPHVRTTVIKGIKLSFNIYYKYLASFHIEDLHLILQDIFGFCDFDVFAHINIICTKCGKIYDYEATSVKKLWSQIVAETGLTPLPQRLDLYALCDECNKKSR